MCGKAFHQKRHQLSEPTNIPDLNRIEKHGGEKNIVFP